MTWGSISLFGGFLAKKKILWRLWLWFSKMFHQRVFPDWKWSISKFQFWRQIFDIRDLSHQANRKPQLRVCSFALPRFQTLARRSVQFSSVHFYLAKIQYNTRIHIGIVRLQGSPEETRRLMKPGLPSLKEISKIKWNSRSDTLKIGTKQRLS